MTNPEALRDRISQWTLYVAGVLVLSVGASASLFPCAAVGADEQSRPNIVFVLTDDHRWDSYGASANQRVRTPNLDCIAEKGTRFEHAFVTLAICSPSRAACLTGRYGSANGVTSVGNVRLNPGEPTFARALRDAGYATGVTGKWHLKTTPEECGFDFVSTCWSNGTWYDRKFTIDGQTKVMPGFVDDVTADESIRFIRQTQDQEKPFVLWLCTQVPHMDHKFQWPAKEEFLGQYDINKMPLPETWNDDLAGKPGYLKTSRNRTKALEYGYDKPENIRRHTRDYCASVEQMDAAVGRVLDELERQKMLDNTWIILMGDNGWMLGEHGMTSKVLPYEESMRVPMAIAGPATAPKVSDDLVLNIDLTATIYQLAGLPIPQLLHGRSLLPIVRDTTPEDWRTSFLYEAPTPQLGSKPLWALRNDRWKYVETQTGNDSDSVFAELYDLKSDAIEKTNLASEPEHRKTVRELSKQLREHQRAIGFQGVMLTQKRPSRSLLHDEPRIPETPPEPARTDIHISGVYPHLTTYGVYSQNGAHYKEGHNECGIGAVVPWAGKLWMVNYAPHMPRGSEHKLFSIDDDMTLTVHPESVGGTPAGRMIHRESNQLFIAHYAISDSGKVRAISPKDMPARVTAFARHLQDPANMIYVIDMEGMIYEVNVHSLESKLLFKKPVPGWHGKGGYTAQGRLVVSNNGEHKAGSYEPLLVGGPPSNREEAGVLAEYDGKKWRIVERKQFTDVTGPGDILGNTADDDRLWAIGWDRRALRLKLLESGQWHTYLLPKATHNNDAIHGWYTEWPRIREIGGGKMMMDMHGMFFDFPKTFSVANTAGIRPISSHLRYVPDFCEWNGKLVIASDETSIQGNPLAGQPQSNLWIGQFDELKQWGPNSGFGGPWVNDHVPAGTPSDPFLINGFDRRVLHLVVGDHRLSTTLGATRATDQQVIHSMSPLLARLPRVTVERGDWRTPAKGYSFEVDAPVTVYLAVDARGNPKLPASWAKTDLHLNWGANHDDVIYQRSFTAGVIEIPGNDVEHTSNAFGMPHTAFVAATDGAPSITPSPAATVSRPKQLKTNDGDTPASVEFALEVDVAGNGNWKPYKTLTVSRYAQHILPVDFDAHWIRLTPSKDCVATAYFHLTAGRFTGPRESMFAGLADVGQADAYNALVYPARRNRDLRVITSDHRFFDFEKTTFEFTDEKSDSSLAELLRVEPGFTVDEASVVVTYRGKRLRLPKGAAAFDKPLESGWPRSTREVESERYLANIHGTFYELPLLENGKPPIFTQMRPVASHSKQISDFCSWNGLLVLAGVKPNAADDGHVFLDPKRQVGVWFGGVDDLWKMGKPVGEGGPWKNTSVRAGQPSDAYLMTGYDRKALTLKADQDTTVTIEIDFDHQTGWHEYQQVDLKAGQSYQHDFPTGFNAHWIRFTTSDDCVATAQLSYQ